MDDRTKTTLIGALAVVAVIAAVCIAYVSLRGQGGPSGPRPANSNSRMQEQYSNYGSNRPSR